MKNPDLFTPVCLCLQVKGMLCFCLVLFIYPPHNLARYKMFILNMFYIALYLEPITEE